LAGVVTLAAVGLWTALWPLDRPAPRGEAIVCLGAGVDAAGRLGPGSRMRAETCAALAREGAAPVLVFSGGPARPGTPSAAAAMARIARAAGSGQAEIRVEERARSTLQNALFTRAMLPGAPRVIVVTEAFHLPRAWASFRAMGAAELALHPAGRVRMAGAGGVAWRVLLRESLALWFNAGRYAVWRAAGVLGLPDTTRTGLLQ
jgi:uncharacterized SAM-binding protein YcdF (DUF218 family)